MTENYQHLLFLAIDNNHSQHISSEPGLNVLLRCR